MATLQIGHGKLTKWSNSQIIRRQIADDLFECVWPFYRVAFKGLTEATFRVSVVPQKCLCLCCISVFFWGNIKKEERKIFYLIFTLFSAGIFKVNNGNTRTMCEIY